MAGTVYVPICVYYLMFFFKFDYVPSDFSLAIIVTLIKNKSGDLCDANYYPL